jgi:hypothetical protein
MNSREFWPDYTIMRAVVCPLCGTRKARRTCPAIGRQICTVCCGTKRLVEIRCPSDCVYLTTARDHPPAAQVRRQQRDLTVIIDALRDLNDQQARLFVAVNAFLARYAPGALQSIVDEDVTDAAAALAATFETASRGVIYEHRTATASGERLATALRAMLQDAGGRGGSAFERDAAVVLRRVEETARRLHSEAAADPRAFLALAERMTRMREGGEDRNADPDRDSAPRLIVP